MGSTHGAIAAGHPLTARAGEAILREGGNAFDAALAALAAACVVEPVLASLGGGGFLLAHPAGQLPRVYDFFAHTPRHQRPVVELDFRPITADFGSAKQEFHIGRGAVAVPGVVKGLFQVHRDLGSVPMREIVGPAKQYAVDGLRVNTLQAYIYRVVSSIYQDTPEARAIYGSRERFGSLVGEGERLCQPQLADILETLAIEGEDLFYRGEIAQAIAQDMRDGGQLTVQDLSAYAVNRLHPLRLTYRDVAILTNPPPSVGGLLIAFGLKLLEDFVVRELEAGGPEHIQLLAWTMELTNEARMAAASNESNPAIPGFVLLKPVYLAHYRAAIRARTRSRNGTTHISVLDAKGNIASLSVSNGEGSGYVVPNTGVMLNNMLGEQDLNPTGFHRWWPDQRISSMMAPTAVIRTGGHSVAMGSGGSNRIRTALLQVLLNIIDFDLSIEEAVGEPRVHYENGLLSVEGRNDMTRLEPVLEAFPRHQIWPEKNLFFGGVHAVARRGSEFHGVGDPRRDGVCLVIGGGN
jgi:gamma-glutamyltranspeptidase/glutathione hydrolase